MDTQNQKISQARFGAAAFSGATDKLPSVFPREMGPNCEKYLLEVVRSGLTAKMQARFEQAFAQAMGVKHCMGAPGCTPALAVLFAALKFEPGDEIIVSPVADYGTVMGLLFQNYIPVFCDAAPGGMNVTADTIAPCLTDRTRAILIVHVAGFTCDMDPIMQLAESRHLPVFEDACQAIFADYKGRIAGTFGKAATFSFDAEKTMGSDIGGAIITNDDELARRCRLMGNSRGAVSAPGFGRRHVEQGYALRMTQSTAAICLAQLEIIQRQIAQRDRTARLFNQKLAGIPGIKPYSIPDYCTTYSCWMHGFSIDQKAFRCAPDEFAAQCAKAGIPNAGLGRYYLMPDGIAFLKDYVKQNRYPFSVPPASRQYDYCGETTPNAKAFLSTFVRWFWTEKYTDEHVDVMVNIVRQVAEKNRA